MSEFIHLQTITDLFKMFHLDDNIQHPLIAMVDFSKVDEHISDEIKISADFYSIMFKNYSKNNIRYGRKPMDFQEGSLICMAPTQVIEVNNEVEVSENMVGWGLFFHPDLIRATSLGNKIKDYHYFSYEISEALHLSEKEKQILYDSVLKIQTELQENIDAHSQSIIVSTLELLLNYCNRFYGRQFITRKNANSVLEVQIEKVLSEYFKSNDINEKGLPTVKYCRTSAFICKLFERPTQKRNRQKCSGPHSFSFN
jgi:hypothetical protein